MRASLLAVLALVFPLFAGAQEDARAALALVMGTAPSVKEALPYVYSYATGYKQAQKTGKPLLVWVGQPAQEIPYEDVIRVEVDSFDEAKSPCVVVARSVGGRVLRIATLNGRPDARTFHRVLHALGDIRHPVVHPPVQRPQLRTAAPSGGC